MKKTTLTLSVITLVTSGLVAYDVVCARPAAAQGARFQFAPNYWAIEEPKKFYYMQQQAMQPRSCSWEGQVPRAQSMFGFDPSALPARRQVPISPPAVSPMALPGRTTAPAAPASPAQSFSNNSVAFNFQFGAGNQPAPPLLIADKPAPAALPQHLQQAPKTRRSVSSQLIRPKERTAKVQSSTPKKRPVEERAREVMGYNDESYSPGSTNPIAYSSGFQTVQKICGQILGWNK